MFKFLNRCFARHRFWKSVSDSRNLIDGATAVLLETLFQNPSRGKHWFKNLTLYQLQPLTRCLLEFVFDAIWPNLFLTLKIITISTVCNWYFITLGGKRMNFNVVALVLVIEASSKTFFWCFLLLLQFFFKKFRQIDVHTMAIPVMEFPSPGIHN